MAANRGLKAGPSTAHGTACFAQDDDVKMKPTQANCRPEWGTVSGVAANYSFSVTNTAVVRAGTVTLPALES